MGLTINIHKPPLTFYIWNLGQQGVNPKMCGYHGDLIQPTKCMDNLVNQIVTEIWTQHQRITTKNNPAGKIVNCHMVSPINKVRFRALLKKNIPIDASRWVKQSSLWFVVYHTHFFMGQPKKWRNGDISWAISNRGQQGFGTNWVSPLVNSCVIWSRFWQFWWTKNKGFDSKKIFWFYAMSKVWTKKQVYYVHYNGSSRFLCIWYNYIYIHMI